MLGEHDEAHKYVALALEEFRSLDGIDTQDGEARCLEVFGTLRHQLGELDTASSYFLASMRLYLVSSNMLGAGHCERALGQVAESRGTPPAAFEHYRNAVVYYERSGDNGCADDTRILIAALEAKLRKPS